MHLQLQPRQHNSLDDSNSSSIVNNHILGKQLPLKRLVEHLRLDLLSSLQLFVQLVNHSKELRHSQGSKVELLVAANLMQLVLREVAINQHSLGIMHSSVPNSLSKPTSHRHLEDNLQHIDHSSSQLRHHSQDAAAIHSLAFLFLKLVVDRLISFLC